MKDYYRYSVIVILICAVHRSYSIEKNAKQMIYSYQECQTDRDCKENSFCYGNDDNRRGNCKCLIGFELYRNKTFYDCIKGVPLGEPCEFDSECKVNNTLATCNRICSCQEDTVKFPNGKCYKVYKIGDRCNQSEDCTFVTGTVGACNSGACGCKNLQVPANDQTHCVPPIGLGGSCTEDQECAAAVNNTVCKDRCQCSTEYVLSRDGAACLKAALKFDDYCTYNGQCSKFLSDSTCENYKCTCQSDYHGYGTYCVRSRHVGEHCQKDEECIYEERLRENVKCENATCSCIFGRLSDGSCKLEKINDPNNLGVNLNPVIFLLVFLFSQCLVL